MTAAQVYQVARVVLRDGNPVVRVHQLARQALVNGQPTIQYIHVHQLARLTLLTTAVPTPPAGGQRTQSLIIAT